MSWFIWVVGKGWGRKTGKMSCLFTYWTWFGEGGGANIIFDLPKPFVQHRIKVIPEKLAAI